MLPCECHSESALSNVWCAGRYSHQARVAQQCVSNAVMHQAKDGMAELIARVVGENPKKLRKAQERNKKRRCAEPSAKSSTYYDEKEKSAGAYPLDHAKFVEEQWVLNSRASENQKDEAKSPCVNPETGKRDTARVHFFTMGQECLQKTIEAVGQLKFGPSFSCSARTMVRLKPFFIKIPGRDVCLCHDHEGTPTLAMCTL